MTYYLLIGGLLFAAGAVLAVNLVPSLAFSSIDLARSGNIAVTDDSNGVVGLTVNDPITEGSKQDLVTVTNNLATSADKVTVSLKNPSKGTLYYGGQSGDSVQASDVPATGSGSSVTFEVDAKLTSDSDWTYGEPCSEVDEYDTANGWNVSFYCASYDSSSDQTQFKYEVVPEGQPNNMKDLSHIVFGFEDGLDPSIVSDSPTSEGEVKTDPVTNVYGLKFDGEISKTGSGQLYTFTIDGDHGTISEDHGLKLGPNEPTVTLPGPSSASGSTNAQTLKFTVEVEWLELTATLTRETNVEPEAPSTPSPTDTSTSTPTDTETDDGPGQGQGQGQGQGN